MDPGARLPRSHLRTLLAAVAALQLASAPATAAPVSTNAVLEIDVFGLAAVTITGSGVVDVSGSTVVVPAGLVQLTSKIVLPVTGVTTVFPQSLTMLTGFANRAATFRMGGVTTQAPSEVCPGSGNNPLGSACNAGGGLGGRMSLTGAVRFVVRPGHVVAQFGFGTSWPYPVPLGNGGSTNVPFEFDGAAWSTGTAFLDGEGRAGTGAPLTLVTPTFLGLVHPIQEAFPFGSFFTTLTLTDVHLGVPEPGALWMVGAGAAGLALLRRQRGRGAARTSKRRRS